MHSPSPAGQQKKTFVARTGWKWKNSSMIMKTTKDKKSMNV